MSEEGLIGLISYRRRDTVKAEACSLLWPLLIPPASNANMIALYSETSDTRGRIQELLAHQDSKSTEDRDSFLELLEAASLGITELGRISGTDVAWLQSALRPGPASPPCIVVAHFSLECLQRLRAIDSSRVHVVWTEEVGEELRRTIDRIDPWNLDPLKQLGLCLLQDYSLHEGLKTVIREICRVTGEPLSDLPTTSITELARRARISPDALRRYWRQQVPLRCRPKELVAWGFLMWAIRARRRSRWEDIADMIGVRRRTLERSSRRLAGCTLATAARDPMGVRQRFDEWVKRVWVAD